MAEIRVVIVHTKQPVLDFTKPEAGFVGHCFGPFESYEAGLAFEEDSEAHGVDDQCYKFAVNIVGPWHRDVDAIEEHDRTHPGAAQVH